MASIKYQDFMCELVGAGLVSGMTAADAVRRAVDAMRWLRAKRNDTGLPADSLRHLIIAAMSSGGSETGTVLCQRALESARLVVPILRDRMSFRYGRGEYGIAVRDANGHYMRAETEAERQRVLDEALGYSVDLEDGLDAVHTYMPEERKEYAEPKGPRIANRVRRPSEAARGRRRNNHS